MSPNLFLLDETRAWLLRAAEDLTAAAVLNGPATLRSALFHCQRAAEKSLKAFLTWHQMPFPRTHNLTLLSSSCVELDASLDAKHILVLRALADNERAGWNAKRRRLMQETNIGSSFDSWLREEGIYQDVAATAIKRVFARQVEAAMKEKNYSKAEMARRMHTSRHRSTVCWTPTTTRLP